MSLPSVRAQVPLPCRPSLWRSEKIHDRHLDRLAVVYVRQSTIQQIARHQESTLLQYGLVDRAEALGWLPSRIQVIDDDLGQTGSSAEGRLGFQRLVAEVGLDHVGLIIGIEMSRLARSCKDWYQLLEACALFGTLIADLDGIYDPAQYNDRLLLGLKGTMSEAELHVIKQRMHQGRLNKARRGELRLPLPIGYFRRPSGEIVLDPDEQAQGVVHLIFDQFERLSTLDGVLRYLVANKIKLPVRSRSGPHKTDLEWHRPNRPTLYNMLKNPLYAGAYAYGRRPTDPRRKQPGRPGTGRITAAPDAWYVLIHERHPAYITWDQFERNIAQLTSNSNRSGNTGVARNGPALLSGLVWCGRCGRRMHVRYPSKNNAKHSYACYRDRSDYGAEHCQSFSGPCVDDLVARELLRALQPAALEVSLQVARDLEIEQGRLDEQWAKRLERARYEVERAERQYHAEEPENRLVTRALAKAWEAKLRDEQQQQEEYARFRTRHPKELSADNRAATLALARDIPGLWYASTTTHAQRTQIVRLVVERVIVAIRGTSEVMDVCIAWAGGYMSHFEIVRPVANFTQLSFAATLLQRVRDMHEEGLTSPAIAEALNREGWRPAKRAKIFNAWSVRTMLSRNGLTTAKRYHATKEPPLNMNEWWLPELAAHLGMPVETLDRWMRNGWINAKQIGGRQGRRIAWADAAELERLKRLRARRRRWLDESRVDTIPAPRPAGW
jgi:DNA invertase Pin-like site-specific DNA recombinase